MSEEDINKAFAEALASVEDSWYECVVCGETFDIGKRARRHAIEEHDDITAAVKHTEGSEK